MKNLFLATLLMSFALPAFAVNDCENKVKLKTLEKYSNHEGASISLIREVSMNPRPFAVTFRLYAVEIATSERETAELVVVDENGDDGCSILGIHSDSAE